MAYPEQQTGNLSSDVAKKWIIRGAIVIGVLILANILLLVGRSIF